ncbi:type-1 angiotensin II receptor-associated protein-like isoform X2 [Styela clava]|uniref:type-1 angiotensin II receptor-associated protein-like isoform X2 n=1 Tax=Styela clava TaxID=7725 RepID=UPI00193A2828|nr:type-1 angiotensin II receptor-associated protein-like isoform X2 [Styela clava]
MPFYGMLLGVMPSISIKLIVLIHWILVVWALVGFGTSAYGWCNITALAIGIWAIADRQSVDALFMFIMMQLFSIVVDIVILAVYFDGRGTGVYKFSAAMCIINLILKPFSSVLLYQMYRDRGGEYNINFGPTDYQDLSGNRTNDAFSGVVEEDTEDEKSESLIPK